MLGVGAGGGVDSGLAGVQGGDFALVAVVLAAGEVVLGIFEGGDLAIGGVGVAGVGLGTGVPTARCTLCTVSSGL